MVDPAPTRDPRRQRRGKWLGLACVAILVGGGVALLIRMTDSNDTSKTICAGIGLAPTRSYPSPEAALSDWLATVQNQPPIEDWDRAENESGVLFTSRTNDSSEGHGYETVTVRQGGTNADTGSTFPSDEWSLAGACVGLSP